MSAPTPAREVRSNERPVARDGNWYPWLEYEVGARDINRHGIQSIHARSDEFIIYFCDDDKVSDLYYECTDELLETTEVPNARLANINRLLPSDRGKRRETLELAADAIEMWLCRQTQQSEKILTELVTQLAVWRETVGRLNYQAAALGVAVVLWGLYWLGSAFSGPAAQRLSPWLLAGALGTTGGFFSVCLNLASIKVNVTQSGKFLIFAGATRALVALIAAVACYLGIQGKIILGLAAPTTELLTGPPTSSMMFFFFLAGFSETFIPNVLRDAEKNTPTGGKAGV